MKENYLSSIGAALILISFGIIISFIVLTSVESKAKQENKTIDFQQLAELNYDTQQKIKNSTTIQQLRNVVGKSLEELKEKFTSENGSIYSELKEAKIISNNTLYKSSP